MMLTTCLWVAACYLAVASAQSYRLIWQDDFDFLDTSKWEHEVTAWGGGNGEFQTYTNDPTNSYVKNGKLHIRPTLTKDNINPLTGKPFGEEFLYSGTLDLDAMYGYCTKADNGGCYRKGSSEYVLPPVMSARLRTAGKFSFKYGRVEIMAKMPAGDWLWPAMWLLPEHWVYGGWPMSGEIDIVEIIGNRDFKDQYGNWLGIQKMGSAMHWGVSPAENRYWLTNLHRTSANWNYADNFHKYVLDWSPNGIRFIIDDVTLMDVPYPLIENNPNWEGYYKFGAPWESNNNPWRVASDPKMAPFDEEFHFLLNVAVGGSNGFMPDGAINQGGRTSKPWRNGDPKGMTKFWEANKDWAPTWVGVDAAMQVDYIKVYQQV